MLTLTEMRQLAEERTQKVCREYYEHNSGQKADMAMASILEAFDALHSRAVIDALKASGPISTDPDERRRFAYLQADILEGYLSWHVAPIHDIVATYEAQKTVSFEGEDIPYRQASVRLTNEPARSRRKELQTATRKVIAELNTYNLQALAGVRNLISQDLGYPSYLAFYREQRGIDFEAFGSMMASFLDRTADLYHRSMDTWTRAELGLPLEQCERHDITYVLRAREFDFAFPEIKLVPSLVATLADLNLSLGHINLDLEKRPTKSPRAFCSPVQVPDEIYLVVAPKGGLDDFSSLFHETGHSLHFAHASPSLPYEFRYLGDNSVTETFAFTFEHFILEPDWLAIHTPLTNAEIARFRYHGLRQLLFMVRRYSAKLLYELELHDSRPLADKDSLYADRLQEALVYRHFPEYWLIDTDEGFYSAQYLRAWILGAQLRSFLRKRHGGSYFRSPGAGEDLVELWRLGQRYPAEEVARLLGFPSLSIDPLIAELESVLSERSPMYERS